MLIWTQIASSIVLDPTEDSIISAYLRKIRLMPLCFAAAWVGQFLIWHFTVET